MALFLGKIGRSILKYSMNSPRINRAADVFGQFVHHKISQRYTPGLTRESFLLWQLTRPGDVVQVETDGFYRKGKKLCGNLYISSFVTNQGISEIKIDDNFFPEYFTGEKTLAIARGVSQSLVSSYFFYRAYDMFSSYGFNVLTAIHAAILAIGSLPLYQFLRIPAKQNAAQKKWFFWQLEQFSLKVTKIEIEGCDRAFISTLQPNHIYGGKGYLKGLNGGTIPHETSHLYGADENSAYYFSGLYWLRELLWKKSPRIFASDVFFGISHTLFWFLAYNVRAASVGKRFFRGDKVLSRRLDKINFDERIKKANPDHINGFMELVDLFVLARAQSRLDTALKIADKIIHARFFDKWKKPKVSFLLEYARALEEDDNIRGAMETYRLILTLIDANHVFADVVKTRILELTEPSGEFC